MNIRSRFARLLPRRAKRTAAIALLATAAACDQPTAPEAVDTAVESQLSQFDTYFPTNAVSCASSALAGDKSMDVRVRLSTGATAAGIVVTVVSPVHGVLCYGATDGDGRIRFDHLKKYAPVLLSIRDEVGLNALGLEIVPPNPVAAALLADQPSLPGNRQEPALLGGTLCNELRPLTWASYLELKNLPCYVTGTAVTLQLVGGAPTRATRVLDASNEPLGGVIVAALSPATITSSDLALNCMVLPWIDQQECTTNSNGPALLQSIGLTDADGRIALGVSFGGNGQPVVIESIAEEDGQTLFGTLFETTGGEQTLLTSPGMCVVETVPDYSQPSGVSKLDIISSAHSVGLSTAVDPASPLAAPALVPVNGTLVVKLSIHATAHGGTGEFGLQYRLATGGIRTVRATFTIPSGHPGTCTVSAGSGKGIGDGVTFEGHCAPNVQAPSDIEPGRKAYTLFFVLSGVDGVKSAEYAVQTDRDHLDPSRSHPAYLRGRVNFTGLDADACPVRLNNDGRWIAL